MAYMAQTRATHASNVGSMLQAEAQFQKDREKKAVAKERKTTKADKQEIKYVEVGELTKKELAALLVAQKQETHLFEETERAKRRSIDQAQDSMRGCYTGWRTRQTKEIKAKEAMKIGRGMVSHSAVRRLQRELAKVNNDPSWGVSAMPIEDNILFWHCNVAAPGGLTGKGVLHLELKFPAEYPAVPPTVRTLGADIDHPNVFGDYICIDMLEKGEFENAESALKPYTGWSSAYGVQTILTQLQSFFFSGVDSGDGKGDKIRIKPWTTDIMWEYQLPWQECGRWDDFRWDPHCFCSHRGARPGCCPIKDCDSKGRFDRRWVPFLPHVRRKIEAACSEWSNTNDKPFLKQSDDIRISGVQFSTKGKQVTRPEVVAKVAIGYASNVVVNLAPYRQKFATAPFFEVTFRMSVAVLPHGYAAGKVNKLEQWTTGKQQLHFPTDLIANASTKADLLVASMPKRAGPRTLIWNKKDIVDFTHDSEGVEVSLWNLLPDGTWAVVGSSKIEVKKLKHVCNTLKPVPMSIDLMAATRKGDAPTARVSLQLLAIKADPTDYSFDFRGRGHDEIRSMTRVVDDMQYNVRCRTGYQCVTCKHTLAEPVPALPSAIDCDDAPPFALAAFHAEITNLAGNNQDALDALERAVRTQKQEDQEQEVDKTTSTNITILPADVVLRIMEYLPRNRERRYMAQVFPLWQPLYENARFWEGQHLRCFTTGADYNNDVLGIGVLSTEVMNGRPVFSCQFDPMSYTAYSEGVRLGVWKEKFTHWIPLYINKEHAQRSMKHLIPMLDTLSVGVRSSNSAWTVCGGGLEGKGKQYLRRVKDAKGHVFRSNGWAGIRGGYFCASGRHYFQVQVKSYEVIPNVKVAGKAAATGVVKVGWVTQTGDPNLGTDSYGFAYSTAGHKVHDAEREPYAPRIEEGDIVGSLWDADRRTITYFLNGVSLGTAFNVPMDGKWPGLIPAVAMTHATVEVDLEDGYSAPDDCENTTLGAHERATSRKVATCLAVLPQLMNHMVVEVMKGKLHSSIKALQGYCALHRLFLHCCTEWEGLQEEIEKTIGKLVNKPSERHKVLCPDLGAVLCLLTVSKKYTWDDVRNAFLTELFNRHVRWSIKKDKRFGAALVLPRKSKDHELIQAAFNANDTSCKLVMFQVFFCNLVKPTSPIEDTDVFEEVIDKYDSRMGFPTAEMAEALFAYCRHVEKAIHGSNSGWNTFLPAIGAETRSARDMAQRIRDAVARSERRGYHADCPLPDPGYAAHLLRLPPRQRLKPGEKPKKKVWQKEKLEEDDCEEATEIDEIEAKYFRSN
ncbi:Ubiquitin carrier protein [Diplonema papillatum]|nr:Ubiquitin carrier protein [Diplonema papillatum]